MIAPHSYLLFDRNPLDVVMQVATHRDMLRSFRKDWCESAIRARFVPDSFQSLSRGPEGVAL
jgi:hypothetical protein